MGHYPPGNFKTLHSNFDIYRNCQRIKMKFYILNIFKKFFFEFVPKVLLFDIQIFERQSCRTVE